MSIGLRRGTVPHSWIGYKGVMVERVDLREELWDGYDQIMSYEILKELIKVRIDY